MLTLLEAKVINNLISISCFARVCVLTTIIIFLVGYADALIAAWIYFLYVFHPDTFNAKILGQSQAFDDWWKRMGKFIQDKPPADDE